MSITGGFARPGIHAATHSPGGSDPLDPSIFDFAQEVSVGIGTGSQYSSIAAACVDLAALATAATPYVVTVGPGVYNEPPFTIPPYVCVNATGGLYTAIIQNQSDLAHFISGSPAAELRNVAVRGPVGGSGFACVDYQGLGTIPFRVKNIRLISGDIGIWCHPATYGVCTVSEAINFTDGALVSSYMQATGWGELRVTNSSYRREAGTSCVNGFCVDGINAYMVVDNTAYKDAGGTNGAFVNNGGYLRMSGCTFTSGVTAFRIGPNGANSRINALSTVIRDTFTNDIIIQSPTGVMQFSGTAHKSKLTVAGGASFVASFSDPAGGASEGQVNIGEFYLGDIAGNEMPVRDYLWFSANTGIAEGGEVTRNIAGGLKLDVAEGEGFISLSGSTGLLEYYWNDITLDMADDTHSWIAVDSTGAVVKVLAEPDGKTSIALAEVVTRAGAVVFLGQGLTVDVYQGLPAQQLYRYEGEGPRCISGVDTTANGVALKVDVGGGSFYIGSNRLSVLTAAAVTFTAWYRAGGGAWVAVPGQTLIDDEQYNIPAGGLGAIPALEYAGHVLYVASTEDGAEYHVVYAQMTNAAPGSLTLPTPPDWLSRTACRSGQIIVVKSAGVIDSINDVRPFAGGAVTGGGAVAEHSLLGGLAVGDDHPQYQLRTEKDIVNGYCGLDAAGLIDQPRLNMTAVPAWDIAEPAGASAGGAPGAKPAWEDHVHEHGNLTGGAHHAVAVAGVSAGFLSAADKTRLDTTVLTTRLLTAGNGLTGGGDLSADRSFTVSPHIDGSVVVGAGGVQVGILASDAQHGNRNGGGLHANVIAGGASGFMTGADKTKLDTFPVSAVPTTLTLTAGNGLTGGGDLSANRTFAVSPHADGSIAVGVGGVQVGTLAGDAQHGSLGGGSLHANAIAGGASGFMTGADKTKLNGLTILHAASHTNGTDDLTVANGIQIAGGSLQPTYGILVNTVCQGNDIRLADARTPTAHQATHVTGADQIPSFSAGNRGLVPAPAGGGGDAALALLGNATWAAPTPATHAASHAVGQPDVLTPLAIGATYPIFAQTATATVTANGVEGTLVGAGVGNLTLPANFFTVGKTIRIRASGIYTRTAGDTLRYRVYLGATPVLDSGAQNPSTVSGLGWIMDVDITCRTAGGGGTLMAQGRVDMASSATASAVWQISNAGATVALNTTLAHAFNLSALWAGTGNSVACTNLIITAMN